MRWSTYISPADHAEHAGAAEEHIAGFMVMCDWSARDIQRHEMLGNLGPAKGKDTATSFSGFLVTRDELEPRRGGNAYRLEMTASVNGRLYSKGSFADIHWRFGELLGYASRGTTLRPGDVIGSGTVGTGCILEQSAVRGSQAYPWLQPGDTALDIRADVADSGAVEAAFSRAEEAFGGIDVAVNAVAPGPTATTMFLGSADSRAVAQATPAARSAASALPPTWPSWSRSWPVRAAGSTARSSTPTAASPEEWKIWPTIPAFLDETGAGGALRRDLTSCRTLAKRHRCSIAVAGAAAMLHRCCLEHAPGGA